MQHIEPAMTVKPGAAMAGPQVDREALLVLRRLVEPGAVLAIARDMDMAVVVREDGAGGSLRTATVDREVAQALALRAWIGCGAPDARIVRYTITNAGRTAMRKLTAEGENRAQGFKTRLHDKATANDSWNARDEIGSTARYMVTESPLVGLARRRDKDGNPFIGRDFVRAGERLREDFELAQLPSDIADDWRSALEVEPPRDLPKAASDARARVQTALADLGPGLADVALRCCCLLEGLEITEKKMGWSARSGKIVLRIALQRLIRHYEETAGRFGPMIG